MQRASIQVTHSALRELAPATGWIDFAIDGPPGWALGGWAILPRTGPFEKLRAYWDGAEIGAVEDWERPDLAEALYWVPRARHAGFIVRLGPERHAGRLDVVGEGPGGPVARVSTVFITPDRESSPLPPVQLAERVSAVSGDSFRLSGLGAATDLADVIIRHAGNPQDLRVLDWGCGCGRISRYLTSEVTRVGELIGCDIDAEAVSWCAQHLAGRFSASSPEPPLPYPDGEIDVILASSVFTHLRRDDQSRWLRELRRILTPNGLVVASVCGEHAFVSHEHRTRTWPPPGSIVHRAKASVVAARLRRAGFIDRSPDSALDGIAPTGYYRAVFQTSAYTRRNWSDCFEIVEYLECGLSGHQDLVVMRPR